jgi:hypothetical protein
LESFACDGGPLRDSVWVDLGVLLELAKRAELGVQDLALLTKTRLTTEPLSAGTDLVLGQAQAGMATKGLSPIAAQRGAASLSLGGPRPTEVGGSAWTAPVVPPGAPESSSMAMARAEANTSQRGAEATREAARLCAQEQALATSRDAELAMELVAREALEKGVDREVVMAAQEIGKADPAKEVETPVAGKGKAKVGESSDLGADLEAGLDWENKLAKKARRGANQVAAVTLQAHQLEQTKLMKAAVAHTQAMACFADGRPLVSPSQRSQLDGSPDWVDNTKKAVQVVTAKGLVAPQRVLLDGGSFYPMVGAKLKAQLGLSEGDMDAGGHRVHTATGKIELLQGGLTKRRCPSS